MGSSAGDSSLPPDPDEVETVLRAQLTEIQARLDALKEPPAKGSAIGFGKRVGDGTTEAVSRFAEVGIANDLEITAARTERALEKLAEGSYGRCDTCGQEIAAGRLRVSPASIQCIDCARRQPR